MYRVMAYSMRNHLCSIVSERNSRNKLATGLNLISTDSVNSIEPRGWAFSKVGVRVQQLVSWKPVYAVDVLWWLSGFGCRRTRNQRKRCEPNGCNLLVLRVRAHCLGTRYYSERCKRGQ